MSTWFLGKEIRLNVPLLALVMGERPEPKVDLEIIVDGPASAKVECKV